MGNHNHNHNHNHYHHHHHQQQQQQQHHTHTHTQTPPTRPGPVTIDMPAHHHPQGHIYGWLGGAFYAAFIALHERKRIQEQREMAAAGSSDFVQSSTRPIMTVHTNVAGVGLNVSCTPEQLANAAGALCTATASASQQANPSSSVWPPRNQSVSQQPTGVQNVLNANVQSANNPDSFCSPLDSARAINVKVV